jgi:hypothetical protein
VTRDARSDCWTLQVCFWRTLQNSIQVSQEEGSVFWEVTVSVTLKQKLYTCPVPTGFRDRAVSLYSSKTVDKKEISRTVSNAGIL